MKIAVTANGGSMEAQVSEKFGRCSYFIIYDTETKKFEAVSNLGEQMSSGAGPKAAELIISKDTNVLLSGHIGDKAEAVLSRTGIKIIKDYTSASTVKDAIDAYINKN